MAEGLVTPPSTLQVNVGARTDTGRRRTANEDAHLAEFPVFIVADGMGGHEAGDRASAAVVAAFASFVGRDDVRPEEIAQAVDAAHTAVAEVAGETTRGAGSTLTGVIAVEQAGQRRWLVVNVGDSRVYRLLTERFEQLTTDHSVAQELVDQGALTREQMATYEGRNVITRAIGAERSRADFWLLPIVTGERLLVCSDGLSGEVSDESLHAGLTMGGSPSQTAHTLVEQALNAGGRDNITTIVVDVVGGGVSPRSEEITGGLMTADEASMTMEVATVRSPRRARNG